MFLRRFKLISTSWKSHLNIKYRSYRLDGSCSFTRTELFNYRITFNICLGVIFVNLRMSLRSKTIFHSSWMSWNCWNLEFIRSSSVYYTFHQSIKTYTYINGLNIFAKPHQFLIYLVKETHNWFLKLNPIFDLLFHLSRDLQTIQFLQIRKELHYERLVIRMSIYIIAFNR